ncbi:MAG: response regulator [Acidimicrobiales bacterium]
MTRQPPTTILVAEDDPSLLLLTCRALEQAGHRVLGNGSAEEALATYERAPGVDALVTDVVLPGIDGLELASRLLARQPELAVLVTTGSTEAHIHEAAAAAGLRVLRKPYTPAHLLAAFTEAWGDRRAEVQP